MVEVTHSHASMSINHAGEYFPISSSSMTGTVETDINSGHKYPDPPGTLHYTETGGSNQVEVQIRVDKPSQHPQPSRTVATARDKQSNLNSAKIIKTRSLHNKEKPWTGGWETKLKMQQEKPAASTCSQLLRVRRRHNNINTYCL